MLLNKEKTDKQKHLTTKELNILIIEKKGNKMKVSELIKELQELENQDAYVVVRGYEGGVDDVNEIEKMKIIRNYNTESFYGSHEELDEYEVKSGRMNPKDAVISYLLSV